MRTGLAEVIRKTAEIKEQVLFNTQLLQELVHRQRGNERGKVCRLPENCKLPLTTYKDVLDIEQGLKSKEFYSNLVINIIMCIAPAICSNAIFCLVCVVLCISTYACIFVNKLTITYLQSDLHLLVEL